MNIFTKYDSKTWNKQSAYPYITITNGEMNGDIYSGYDLDEFFKEFDRKYFLEYDVIFWVNLFTWSVLGKVKDFTTLKRACDWEIVKTA